MAKDKQVKKTDTDNEEEDDSKIFPQRLMEILADERNQEAICWLPHGRAFMIRKRDLFAETVMPRYFSRKAKYSSFTRKLNRWNFVRVSSGPELGAYYHEFFLRDKPHLAAQMFCKNARTMLAMASGGEAPTASQAAASAVGAPNLSTKPAPLTLDVAAPQPLVQPHAAPLAAPQIPLPPVTPALLAALTKDPATSTVKGTSALQAYAPTNVKLLEMHILQQEQANRILFEHAMRMSLQQRQEQQVKLANDQAQLRQMRQLMQIRSQQQQARHRSKPSNGRAHAA